MGYLKKFNYDDVYFRALSVALLDYLSSKVYIWNRIDTDNLEYVDIPFYYDLTGDERFMQDHYLGDSIDDCIPYNKITEGGLLQIPRGHIRYTSFNIVASSLSNRFVRVDYTKEDKGQLVTHNAPVNQVPLEVNYDVKIYIDGELDLMKVEQKLIEIFYKAHAFSFIFNGFVIQAQMGFPDDDGANRQFEHGYGDDTQRTVEFSLQVSTYLPVIKEEDSMRKNQRIEKFSFTTNADLDMNQSKNINSDIMYSTIYPNNVSNNNTTVPISNDDIIRV